MLHIGLEGLNLNYIYPSNLYPQSGSIHACVDLSLNISLPPTLHLPKQEERKE